MHDVHLPGGDLSKVDTIALDCHDAQPDRYVSLEFSEHGFMASLERRSQSCSRWHITVRRILLRHDVRRELASPRPHLSTGGGLRYDVESGYPIRGGGGWQTGIDPEGGRIVLSASACQVEVGGEEN